MALSRDQVKALRFIAQTASDVDAMVTADRTFWDTEVHAGYVHWRTAVWLREQGFVTFERDGEETMLHLTDAGRTRAAQLDDAPLRRR